MLARIGRLWRTARHLKPVQIYGRLWFRYYKPKVCASPVPNNSKFRGLTTHPARRTASMVGPRTWKFLNEKGGLDEVGWQNKLRPKLWRYNQHYFDDLNACKAAERSTWHIDVIDRWIDENPVGSGNGWEPYPTSLRIVNWIKWASAGNTLPPKALESLSVQARWLYRRLEWHLLGNHLFSNAKALLFAGIFFEGKEASKWLEKGFDIVERQLSEQILPDGAHFELSPMYHAIALEDILDLINLASSNYDSLPRGYGKKITADWRATAERMLTWQAETNHPDGEFAFFNDSAFNVAPTSLELQNYAERLKIYTTKPSQGVTYLPNCGYAVARSGEAFLIADVGQIGPSYLPAHAHADTLSFEFSIGSERIFVNSGTSTYESSGLRAYQRSTQAHNTAWANNKSSSETWASFRVGKRARILDANAKVAGKIYEIRGAHDGYRNLLRKNAHYRKFQLGDKKLSMYDAVPFELNFFASLYIHPDIEIVSNEINMLKLRSRNGTIITLEFEHSEFSLHDTSWYPEFGLSIPNVMIKSKIRNGESSVQIQWE